MQNTNPAKTALYGSILPVISQESCRCSPPSDAPAAGPDSTRAFVLKMIATPAGPVPQVATALKAADYWGTIKARWGEGRMTYRVDPGLYAVGYPNEQSPVLVSANYKMSFDHLRASLAGRDVWVLVLDTKGINVWCAAGKGTFGTEELIYRIESSGLRKAAPRANLILPQLGAPGVAAHVVKRKTGCKVQYGPVRAADLGVYLDAGCKATAAMRKVTFGLKDRAALIPMELSALFRYLIPVWLIFALLASVLGYAALDHSGLDVFWAVFVGDGLFPVFALGAAVLAGAVLHPVFLPLFPVRAFSGQGAFIGGIVAIAVLSVRGVEFRALPGLLEAIAWLFMIAAVSSYLAMNFTGSSTYASLSGVKKEMRLALPLQIVAGSAGCLLWVASLILSGGWI